MLASKNPLSPAATDLGLGDMLRPQLEDETEEQRRKRMAAAGGGGDALSPAASLLFGGLSGRGY